MRPLMPVGAAVIATVTLVSKMTQLEGMRAVHISLHLFFAIAAEQFRQTGANCFRLWLENLPHGIGSGVFLFPSVTDERLGHDPRAGRNAAIVQVDDATRDGE